MRIPGSLVKQLRQMCGAGILDCKTALVESKGDIDKAVDWLRKKGLATAAKKSGRIASEGLVGITVSQDCKMGAMLEVNSETDFVARNEKFQSYVQAVCKKVQNDDLASLKAMHYKEHNTVEDALMQLISVIGENISLRRATTVSVSSGVVGSYMHAAVRKELGRIGVLVGLVSKGDPIQLQPIASQIAMHIAASKPIALSREDLDPHLIEREKNVLHSKYEDRPKKVEKELNKYYKEVVLLEQPFVVDPGKNIRSVLEKAEKTVQEKVSITEFRCFILGEDT